MLNFTYIYRDAYNELCSNCDMKMRKYEIKNHKWEIAKQLADVLKVKCFISISNEIYHILSSFSKTRPLFSLVRLPILPR
jgi:hypothetical protein